VDKQLQSIEPRLRSIRQPGSSTYEQADLRHDWMLLVYNMTCPWVDEDEGAQRHFPTYVAGFMSLLSGTVVLTPSFISSKEWPAPQCCFMAEREMNLPPYTLLLPLFLAAVLPADQLAKGNARLRGSECCPDPDATYDRWIEQRGDDLSDRGLTARVRRKTPDRTPASLKALTKQLSHIVVSSDDDDESDSKQHDGAAASPARPDDQEDGDEPDEPSHFELTGELYPGYFDK
jgi:hypothetical protein